MIGFNKFWTLKVWADIVSLYVFDVDKLLMVGGVPIQRNHGQKRIKYLHMSVRKKCPYSELFWSAFSRSRTKYGEIQSISSYSVRMWENAVQNNSEYGHFLPSAYCNKFKRLKKGSLRQLLMIIDEFSCRKCWFGLYLQYLNILMFRKYVLRVLRVSVN